MSSKQQIEGNILHTEQELISALPSVHGKQDCLQPILTLASGFMPEVTFRSAQQVQDGLAIKASISIGVENLGGERRGGGGFRGLKTVKLAKIQMQGCIACNAILLKCTADTFLHDVMLAVKPRDKVLHQARQCA